MSISKSMRIPEHLAPRPGAPLMFAGNPLLERLSHVSPVTVLAVFLPATVVVFFYALMQEVAVITTVALFLTGIAFWTLFEYVFHRFVFHLEPTSSFKQRLQFVIHGVHHQYPEDKTRLVMPVTVSIPLSLLMLWGFMALLGEYGWGFFSGFMAGYLGYDMLHYAVHHVRDARNPWFRRLQQHHLAHHFRDTQRGFGVSSPLWDRVFRS